MLRKTIQQAAHQLFGQGLSEEAFSKFSEGLHNKTGVVLTQRPEELSPLNVLLMFRMLRGAL
jgi:hypothetical protein